MNKGQTTADDIIRCARALIVKGGYNGFSYADISDVVGIRKASIHHHFPSKADLVRTLVAEYRAEAAAAFAGLDRNVPDPAEQLRAYVAYWEACITDASNPFCVCALLASEMDLLPKAVAIEVRAHFRTLSGWLASVFERGGNQGRLISTGTAQEAAETFMATVHGAMLSARAYGDANVFRRVTQSLMQSAAA